MIICKELGSTYETKEMLLKELKAKKDELFLAKKGTLKYSDAVPMFVGREEATQKAEEEEREELKYGDYVYPVINTINYLDSHMDVHLPGIWNKSVKEQKGKTSLIINHDFKVGSVIAFPEDVEPMVKVMKWSELGRSYEGETEALIFKSKMTSDSNNIGFSYYKNRRKVQHSICMEYVKFELCVDSDDDDWKKERKNWEKYLPNVVNPENAIKFGYFWAVIEAKIYREGSMVLQGSNDATPVLYEMGAEKITPDAEGTENKEPAEAIPERLESIKELINLIKN
jgi:hypothetical protein